MPKEMPKTGRYRALGIIKARIGEMKAGGRGGAVFILEATGHGPGGLAERFRHQMGTEGCRWLAGHCQAGGPFQQVLREISLETGEHRKAARELSEQKLGQCREEYRNLIVDLARERPMVLALEDWHLADRAAVEIFEFLLGAANQEPILFLISLDPQGVTKGYHSMETAQRIVSKVDVLRLRDWTEKLQSIIGEKVGGEPLAMDEAKLYELQWAIDDNYYESLLMTDNYDKAMEIAEQSFKISKRLRDYKKEAISVIKIGQIHFYSGKYDLAESTYKKALKLSEEQDNLEGQAESLQWLGAVFSKRGDYDVSMEYNLRALSVCESMPDKKTQAECLIRIGEIHANRGEHGPAQEFYHRVLNICRDIGDLDGQARALEKIGNIYAQEDDLNKALEYYEKALAISEESGNRIRQAYHLINAGMIELELGLHDQALGLMDRALHIQRKTGYIRGEGDVLMTIGQVLAIKGELDMARAQYEKALGAYKRAGCQEGQSICLNSIGALHEKRGEYRDALGCFEKALKISKETGQHWIKANSLENVARMHHILADFEKSLDKYEECRKIYSYCGDRRGQADCLQNIGSIHSKMGNYHEAMECVQKALEICQELNSRHGVALCHYTMGTIHADRGEYEKALELLNSSLKVQREIELHDKQCGTLCYAAIVKIQIWDTAGAQEDIDQGLKLAKASNSVDDWALCQQTYGLLHSKTGNYQMAEDHYLEAVEYYTGRGRRNDLAHACLDFGRMLKASGDNEKAREQLERAKTLFEEMKLDYWIKKTEEEFH